MTGNLLSGDSIGWQVQFCPCELQMTDFENAAVTCFVVIFQYNPQLQVEPAEAHQSGRPEH